MTTCRCPLIAWMSTIRSSTSVGTPLKLTERTSSELLHHMNKLTPADNCRFPCVLPFSQMYPLCCIDIRNFLNQIYQFSDDQFQYTSIIDETLQKVKIPI